MSETLEMILVILGMAVIGLSFPTYCYIAIELEERKAVKFLHHPTINTYVTNYLVHSDKWHHYSDEMRRIEAKIDSFLENKKYLPEEENLKNEISIQELQKEYVEVRKDFEYHGNKIQTLYELILEKLVELGIKEEEVTKFIKLLFEQARMGK